MNFKARNNLQSNFSTLPITNEFSNYLIAKAIRINRSAYEFSSDNLKSATSDTYTVFTCTDISLWCFENHSSTFPLWNCNGVKFSSCHYDLQRLAMHLRINTICVICMVYIYGHRLVVILNECVLYKNSSLMHKQIP